MKMEVGWLTNIRGTHPIRVFTDWKSPAAFQKAFEQLLGDLKSAQTIPPQLV
jgi:hypothetical protein